MIHFLKHQEIDRALWTHCLETFSKNPLIYGYPDFLDIVSPNWAALVEKQNGEYWNIFPLCVQAKWGFQYIQRAPFTQQLGLFGKGESDIAKVNAFLSEANKRYRLGDYSFQKLNPEPLKSESKDNYILSLDKPYEELHEDYNSNRKRNLKKAKKVIHSIQDSTEVQSLIELYEKSGSTLSLEEKRCLVDIQESDRISSVQLSCFDEARSLEASSFFILHQNTFIYLLGAATESGYKHGAPSLIFDHLIAENAKTTKVLDFEGSSIPGVASFFKSFGARREPYHILHRNRMPQLMRIFKKLTYF